MESPCHPPTEDNTKILYIITKDMFHLFSCSMSLGTLGSNRETGRMSFSIIARYSPELISQLHCSEAALQFAENMTPMLFCRVCTAVRPPTGKDEFQVPWGHRLYRHVFSDLT
jgi:hypothetical protein